jgi:hypothetical protein
MIKVQPNKLPNDSKNRNRLLCKDLIGIVEGAYGNTPQEINDTIRIEREAWSSEPQLASSTPKQPIK